MSSSHEMRLCFYIYVNIISLAEVIFPKIHCFERDFETMKQSRPPNSTAIPLTIFCCIELQASSFETQLSSAHLCFGKRLCQLRNVFWCHVLGCVSLTSWQKCWKQKLHAINKYEGEKKNSKSILWSTHRRKTPQKGGRELSYDRSWLRSQQIQQWLSCDIL